MENDKIIDKKKIPKAKKKYFPRFLLDKNPLVKIPNLIRILLKNLEV